MINSFLLSLFMFVFLLLSIFLFDKVDFNFLKTGREIKLNQRLFSIIVTAVILMSGMITWLVIYKGGPSTLQFFYILIFSGGFFISLFLILAKLKHPLILSAIITSLILLIILWIQSQLLQNFFMAFSLLWVGPFVLKKLNLRLKYFLLFIIAFALIDIYNIYFTKIYSGFSDDELLLNGLIIFGDYLLGIGDFFLAYLVTSFVKKEASFSATIILALIISFTRFVFRLLSPDYSQDIPYSMVIVPATIIIYLTAHKNIWSRKSNLPL